MTGKGDTRRPMFVTPEEYKQNFDRIFNGTNNDKASIGNDVVSTPTTDNHNTESTVLRPTDGVASVVSTKDRQRYYTQSYRDPLR